ncbi:BTB/POZ domain-containing protein 19-like isoform X1 [Hemiscyllium ocellatum]|uniref:BTB/POZ domain-containing protein 19-like isoform X1 n=1 Tax=Hemiscyllium ocellatum TaxID=170820 RepID=UPI00296694C9|nr:BTB/POZ domain-containing protein 19-like isoform X1 [Hemiscyllium ocellatum]
MSNPFHSAYLRGSFGSFAADMRKMINAPEMSDVKFIVGEEQKVVYAHRCILAYRCEAFRTMFAQRVLSRDAKEAEVPFVLSDVQPDVFLAVVEFLYTNCVMLSRNIALDVLTSAVEYGLDELQRMCVDYINSTLTVESACEALQAAVTYRQTNMKDKCLAFIEGHTKSIVKTRGFHELSDLALLAILQSDMLTIDEPDLINFVREWAHVNSVVLDKPVPEIAKDVIGELRLFLLSPEELTILEAENMKDNLIPMDKIAEVWKFHALKKPSGIAAHLPRRRKGTRLREHHKYLNLYHK